MNDSAYGKLVARLGESGALGVGWRGAFLRTPRSPFVPERIWIEDGPGGYRPITRQDSPEEWWAKVHADDVVVTQLDDGDDNGPGVATSSVSMPTLVARMMAELDLRPTHSVLEIGSGWSTGLLCERVGQDRVVSVEIDAEVAARAGSALESALPPPSAHHGRRNSGIPREGAVRPSEFHRRGHPRTPRLGGTVCSRRGRRHPLGHALLQQPAC